MENDICRLYNKKNSCISTLIKLKGLEAVLDSPTFGYQRIQKDEGGR